MGRKPGQRDGEIVAFPTRCEAEPGSVISFPRRGIRGGRHQGARAGGAISPLRILGPVTQISRGVGRSHADSKVVESTSLLDANNGATDK